MDKKTLKELEKKLRKEKESLEEGLKKFSQKDKKIKDDWDTNFPSLDGESGSSALESAADAVEEYMNLLPQEYNLELRLKDVNDALGKIKKGNYGTCENCKQTIPLKRLKVSPAARLCLKCQK